MTTLASGLALARWLAETHPGLLLHLNAQIPARAAIPPRPVGVSLRGLGDDDFTLSPVTIDMSEPSLIDVTSGIDSGVSLPSFDFSATGNSAADPSSGGFLSSIGSAISNVGSFLTTGGGLNTLANTATAYFKAQQTANNAQVSTAVLQAQAARAGVGASPAAVSYVTNPLTGQLTPVLSTAGGAVPLTNSLLNSLTPGGFTQFLNQYGLYLLLGAGVLITLASLRSTS